MLVGDHRYDEVSLQAERTSAGTNLLLDSAAVAGIVRWPTPDKSPRTAVVSQRSRSQRRFISRGSICLTAASRAMASVSSPRWHLQLSLAVDELNWRGRSLGRLTATMTSKDKVVSVEDAHLVNGTQDAHGVLHCQTATPTCRLTFAVDSTDAAATLEDFGFKPDLTASSASLNGEVEWHPTPGQPWLAGVQGTVTMRLADGTLRNSSDRALQSPLAGVGNSDTSRATHSMVRAMLLQQLAPVRHESAPVARNGIREAAAAPFATLTDVGDGSGDAHDLSASSTNADKRSAVEAPPTNAEKRPAAAAAVSAAVAVARASSRTSTLASVDTQVGGLPALMRLPATAQTQQPLTQVRQQSRTSGREPQRLRMPITRDLNRSRFWQCRRWSARWTRQGRQEAH